MIYVISNRLDPARNSGDIHMSMYIVQAINDGSSHVHINLQYKMWTVERENGWLTTMTTSFLNFFVKSY